MTVHVNIAKAKATLSDLVARAEAGEEVVLTRNGKPIVTLAPVPAEPQGRRRLGVWAHLNIKVPDEVFFEPDAELEGMMEDPIWPPKT
jgi:prevent-host-death family protein